MPDKDQLIYKLLTDSEWESFQIAGEFSGSEADRNDGFIHFSTRSQVAETARKHFSHHLHVWLLEVDTRKLNAELKWEVSRGGALFPHLYADLPLSSVVGQRRMETGSQGLIDFQEEES